MTASTTVRLLAALLALSACAGARAQGGAVTCAITNAPVLDFGQPVTNPTVRTDSSADVSISCTGSDAAAGSAVRVCLLTPPSAPQVMRKGSSALPYALYADSGRTQPLGHGAAIVAALQLGDRPQVTAQTTLTVYGRIPAGVTGLAGGEHDDRVPLQLRLASRHEDCSGAPVQAMTMLEARARLASGSCSVIASNLDFGVAHDLARGIDASAALGVNCTAGTAYTVELNGGTVGHDPGRRRMGRDSHGDTVAYQLYRDSARSQVWGGTAQGVTGIGTGTPRTHTVYGRLGAQPTPPAGVYRDTITATVIY